MRLKRKDHQDIMSPSHNCLGLQICTMVTMVIIITMATKSDSGYHVRY